MKLFLLETSVRPALKLSHSAPLNVGNQAPHWTIELPRQLQRIHSSSSRQRKRRYLTRTGEHFRAPRNMVGEVYLEDIGKSRTLRLTIFFFFPSVVVVFFFSLPRLRDPPVSPFVSALSRRRQRHGTGGGRSTAYFSLRRA